MILWDPARFWFSEVFRCLCEKVYGNQISYLNFLVLHLLEPWQNNKENLLSCVPSSSLLASGSFRSHLQKYSFLIHFRLRCWDNHLQDISTAIVNKNKTTPSIIQTRFQLVLSFLSPPPEKQKQCVNSLTVHV